MAIPPALAWSYLLCGYDAIRERNPKLRKTLNEGIFGKKKKKKEGSSYIIEHKTLINYCKKNIRLQNHMYIYIYMCVCVFLFTSLKHFYFPP
jgi:hypothetical protein